MRKATSASAGPGSGRRRGDCHGRAGTLSLTESAGTAVGTPLCARPLFQNAAMWLPRSEMEVRESKQGSPLKISGRMHQAPRSPVALVT